MTFIFTSHFSVLFSSCLNSTELLHILYKHTDTEDTWITSGSSRNNSIYAFLLERSAFLSCLLLWRWIKQLFLSLSCTFYQRYFPFSAFDFSFRLHLPRFFEMWTGKRPLDSESRDLSSSMNVPRGRGKSFTISGALVSLWQSEQLNSQVPSDSDILFANITLFYFQATKSRQAIYKVDQWQSMKNLPAYN